MIDGPSAIDPLVAEGPLLPMETLRPLASLQRVVLLDRPGPMMADLETGDFRQYENGPPVSVPMVSNVVDFAAIDRLQVQVLRDPRPTSVEVTLLSLHLGDAGVTIDVRESPMQKMSLHMTDSAGHKEVTAPIGKSSAIVVVIERNAVEGQQHLTVQARNAESMSWTSVDADVSETGGTTLTVGGPTTAVDGMYGRSRMIPVQLEVTLHGEPIDQVRRVVQGARRAVGALRSRVG